MYAVTIHDTCEGFLAYDLRDLLDLAGAEAVASTWLCEDVDSIGPAADEFHRSRQIGPITGEKMIELASGISQTIDGDFEATLPGNDKPWLILRAIDGCYFVVITRSEALIVKLKKRFHDVRPSPGDLFGIA